MTDNTDTRRRGPYYVGPPNAMKSWKPTSSVPTATVRTRGDSIEVSYNFQHRFKPSLERQALKFARRAAKDRLKDQKASVAQIDSETGRIMTYLLARREEWFTDGADLDNEEKRASDIITELFA